MKTFDLAYERLKKIGVEKIIKNCLIRKVGTQFSSESRSRHVNIMISGFTE
jgi:hypothetical protein